MQSRLQKQRRITRRRGFTLTELLVVIGLIMILATIMGVAFSGRSGAAALPTAQRIAASVFQAARGTAILNPSVRTGAALDSPTVRLTNPRVRVLVHNDPSDPDRYLRFFGTVIGGTDPTDGTQKWSAVTQGTTLPGGLFFVPPTGGAPANTGESMPARSQSGAPTPTMNLEFPRAGLRTAGSGPTWLVYEFDSSGRAVSNDLNRVVIATGFFRQDGHAGASVYFDNPFTVTGFVVLPSGTLALFRDPDDIAAAESDFDDD